MGKEQRVTRNAQEMVQREIERSKNKIGRVVRFAFAHPRLSGFAVTLAWPIYALFGELTQWRMESDIFAALSVKTPNRTPRPRQRYSQWDILLIVMVSIGIGVLLSALMLIGMR